MSSSSKHGSLSGGRVKEPKVTFKRPLRVHSDTEQLTELSKAWSSFGDTKQMSGYPNHLYKDPSPILHDPSSHSTRSHDFATRSHDHSLRSHNHDLRPHNFTNKSHDCRSQHSPEHKRTHVPSTYYSSHSSLPKSTTIPHSTLPYSTLPKSTLTTLPHTTSLSASRSVPSLPHHTSRLLSSVYSPSYHRRSPSPPKSNPRALFGASVNFKDHTSKPGPYSATDVTNWPIVNGSHLKPTHPTTSSNYRQMIRKTVRTANGTNDEIGKRGGGDIEGITGTKMSLSDDKLSNLLQTIEQQKRERAIRERHTSPPPSHKPHPLSQPSHAHKRRKVVTAPPPKGYTGFTSSSEHPISFKPKIHPLPKATPIPTHSLSIDEPKWASAPKKSTITPSSWRYGQELANRVLGKEDVVREVPSIRNAAELLKDLESSEEEEMEQEVEQEMSPSPSPPIAVKRPSFKRAMSPVEQVLKLSESENQFMRKHRDYDREAVQQYMNNKQEERKRKLIEERVARQEAENDRKKRLEELREKQQRLLTSNLQAQLKRKREEFNTDLGSVHIHLTESTPQVTSHLSTSLSHPPSLFTSSHMISTPHPPITSSRPNITSSSHHHPPISFSHSTPSLMTPLSTGATTSNRRPSPRVSLNFTSLPSSPPPPSLPPASTSIATPLILTSPHTIASPYSNVPITSTDLVLSPHTTITTTTTSCISPPITSPSIPITSTCISSSTSNVHVPVTGSTVSTLLSPHHVTSNVPYTSPRGAKLLALQHSALSLRQRIENERKKLETLTANPPPSLMTHISPPPKREERDHHHLITSNSKSPRCVAFSTTNTTSTIITPVYTTPTLSHTTPTLSHTMPTHPVYTTPTLSYTIPTHPVYTTPTHPVYTTPTHPVYTMPTLSHTTPTHPVYTTPNLKATPTTQLPWQQKGGDAHSVINIYSRQQKRQETTGQTQLSSSTQSTTSSNGESSSTVIDEEKSKEEESGEGEESEGESEKEVKEKDKTRPDDDLFVTLTPINNSSSSKSSSSSSTSSSQSSEDMSVITPPDTPSLHESFVTPPRANREEYKPPPLPTTTGYTVQQYSPQSLGLRLRAELNILEAVEEGVRQVEGVESARAVAEAQQETVALAQLLQSQARSHDHSVRELTNRTNDKLKQAQDKLDKAREEALSMTGEIQKLKENTDTQSTANNERLRQLEEESIRAHALSHQKLVETQAQLTSAVLQSTHVQYESARLMAEDMARAAAEGAVTAVLKKREGEEKREEEEGSYKSDFEPVSFDSDSLNTTSVSTDVTSPPPPSSNGSHDHHSPTIITTTSVPYTSTVLTTTVPTVLPTTSAVIPTVSSTLSTIPSSIASTVTSTVHTVLSTISTVPSIVPTIPSTTSSSIPTIPSTVGSSVQMPLAFSPPVVTNDSSLTVDTSLLSPHLSGGSNKSSDTTLTPEPPELPHTPLSHPHTPLSHPHTTPLSHPHTSLSHTPLSHPHTSHTQREEDTTEEIEENITSEEEEEEDKSTNNNGGGDDDIDEVSFRELLPSETHRRQRTRRRRLLSGGSDTSDIPPLHSGDISPVSVGEESFQSFVTRMVKQYVKEEEMRAKHQAALLKLRERAIKESSAAKLEWLKVQMKQVQSKRDDEAMPRLLRKEEGVLRKLKQQEAEIKHLEEAQRRASQHRKLLLLQQEDISRCQQSTQQYKEKIRRYRLTGGINLDYSPSPSPSPSLDLHHPDSDISESLSLPLDSPVKSSSVTEQLSSPSSPTGEGHGQEAESPNKSISESQKLLKLKEISNKKEKDLQKYEKKLLKRRQTAEELLQYKEELLKKERDLKTEEHNINKLIEEAIKTNDNTSLLTNSTSTSIQRTPVVQRGGDESEGVTEEILTTAYTSGSFDTDRSTPLTSTPHTDGERRGEEVSVSIDDGREDEKRLLQLQQQLQLKEQELKRRRMEAARAKKEIITQQEQAIQARLKEVEDALKTAEQETVVHAPLITVSPAAISEAAIPSSTTTATTTPHPPIDTTVPHPTIDTTVPHGISGLISPTVIHSSSPVMSPLPVLNKTSPSPPPPPPSPPVLSSSPPSIPPPPADSSSTTTTTTAISEHIDESPVATPITSPVHVAITPPLEVTSPVTVQAISPLATSPVQAISPLGTSPEVTPPLVAINPLPVEEEPLVQQQNDLQPLVPPPSTEGIDLHLQQSFIETLAQQTSAITQQTIVTSPLVQHEPIASTSTEQTNVDQMPPPRSLLSPQHSPSPLSLTPDIPDQPQPSLNIGQRALVANKVQGIIRYIGYTGFASGVWVGIELDEARGKNDGSVNEQRYFTCPANHGVFAPPSKVIPLKEKEGEESSSETKSISEEIEDDNDDLSPSPSPSPQIPPLLPVIPITTATTAVKDSGSESLTSVSQLTNEEGGEGTIVVMKSDNQDDTLVEEKGEENEEEKVDQLTGELVRQLSDEAFHTVHEIWKEKKQQEKDGGQSIVDSVTDQLLTALVQSEVDLICNIRDTREALMEEEKEKTTTSPVRKTKEKRGLSFSSEPLALVPSSRHDVNRIVEYIWNTLIDNNYNLDALPPCCSTSSDSMRPIPKVLLQELCNKSGGVMFTCEKDFVCLVFDLTIDVIRGQISPSRGHKMARKMSSTTLEYVQDKVHTLLHRGQRPHPLPPLRYLHNNCRPGGKEIDFVDTLLLSEMRAEEGSWVDYHSEEENIRARTADEILNFLLDETVEVIQEIYNKRGKSNIT